MKTSFSRLVGYGIVAWRVSMILPCLPANQNGLSPPSDEVMAAKETQIKAAPRMGFAVEPPEAS